VCVRAPTRVPTSLPYEEDVVLKTKARKALAARGNHGSHFTFHHAYRQLQHCARINGLAPAKHRFHFMTERRASYDPPISLYDRLNSLYDRTHIFDEGKQIVVGSVLNDAGARWGERVDGSSGDYFQMKVEGIV